MSFSSSSEGAGTPLPSPRTGNIGLLEHHPRITRPRTTQTDPTAPAPTTSNTYATSTTWPDRHTSTSRPNRCEYCLLHRKGCDGVRPQCGECEKKEVECVMPTTGKETISRSEMQRRVAKRQQRELEARGVVEMDSPDVVEEGNNADGDNIEMGELGEAERRSQQTVARPAGGGSATFGSGMQEEDLFPLGTCHRPPSDPSRAPSRGDGELSDVDEADLVRQSVTRRQPGDQLVRKRKRTPEGEHIRRNAVKVAKTAEDVGAAPVEQEEDAPVELALGEAGIVAVTDDTFVEQQGANIEGVDTDDDILPTTETTFDATSRLFHDHDSNLQALDRPSSGTTTRLNLNWDAQPLRRPDGTYNPIISADAADTFLPDILDPAQPAGTPEPTD